ncbi:FYB1 protein, partial [Malurus elegans]|nr:FYB1 protein [Malurus elegans]
MEKFEAASRDTEDASNNQPVKKRRQDIPTGLQTRKAAFEKFESKGHATSSSGPSALPKSDPKSLGIKHSSDDKREKDPNLPHLNPVAQRFGVQLQPTNRGNYEKTGCTKLSVKTSDPSKEDPKPLQAKPAQNKFLAPPEKGKNPLGPKPNLKLAPQESEAKPEFSKVAAAKEKLRSAAQENEPKPPVSKPPLAQKPSLNNEVSQNEDTSNKSGFLQRLSGPKTNVRALQEAKEMGENNNSAAESAGSHLPKIALKPTGHRSSLLKGTFKNVEENTEEKGMSSAQNILLNKTIQEESGSSHKFRKMNTALAAGGPSGEPQEREDGNSRSRIPKRKALPPVFKLGQPPEKPQRPPTVNLGKFQKSSQKKNTQNEDLKQKGPFSAAPAPSISPSHYPVQLPPRPPASHPFLQVPAAPSLPPRNIKPSSETIGPDNEENYDDVEFVSQGKMHTFYTFQLMATIRRCKHAGQESDGEMYEDINDIRSQRRKEKKQDKEDKRRKAQEKRAQKGKEKKEQELRRKFKLRGPIEVLHQARACVDHKGGKNELTVKQGDKIEIIRLTDNPEGKWLGRTKRYYGYIKTTMVEIDYDSLKRKQQPSIRADVKHTESDQETYYDTGEQDTTSRYNIIFYIVIITCILQRSVSQDEDKNGIWSWGILKRLKVKDDKKKSVREKTAKVNEAEENENLLQLHFYQKYQKVCQCIRCVPNFVLSATSWFSSSKSASFGKRKSEEKDVQKLKKMEKEEKEFRKKFRFDGEIKVLYSTTTVQDLPPKRWGYKHLQIKAGETLDVIESTDDTKVLCRNEEGK